MSNTVPIELLPAETAVEEINRLHGELEGLAKTSLQQVIRIGELLTQQKSELKHGQWLPWVEDNLPFDRRTATNYMAVYSKRETISHLDSPTEAYRLLANPPKDTKPREPSHVPAEPDPESGVYTELSKVTGRFACIYADPPWKYGNQGTRAATSKHYNGLTIEQLCEMPVAGLAAENAHLHLWTTNGFLFDAQQVMEAWGFTYKSCFVWVKPQMGIGNYWRVSHEFMLLGVRGKLTSASKSLKSWAEIKRGKHSAKPDEVRVMVEKMSPGPRLELFGRKPVDGWTVFGDQMEAML